MEIFGIGAMVKQKSLFFLVLFCLGGNCWAKERVIRGFGMDWKPVLTFAQPGDQVRFIDMIGHDTESIKGMIPPGTNGWKSKMGDEGFTVTLDADGLYVFKCNPHVAVGMFGAIIVGDPKKKPANLPEVRGNLDKVRIGRSSVKKILKKVIKAIESKASS